MEVRPKPYYGLDHSRCDTQLSVVGYIVDRTVHRMLWIIFYNSTVVHTKMGHVSKTTPLWQDLIYSPFVQNFRALASAIPEIWMGPQNLKRVT